MPTTDTPASKQNRKKKADQQLELEKQVIETWAFRKHFYPQDTCKADALPLSHIPYLKLK